MHLHEIWKVDEIEALLSVMVIVDGLVLADTNYLKAKLHMSLCGGMGSCDSNTSFQMFPENSLRIAVTVLIFG